MLYQGQNLVIGGLLFLLATGTSASAIKPRAGTDDDEPAPWTPLTMALPWPYGSPSLSIPSDTPNTALLRLYYSNPCGGATEFASTKTVNLPVDCHGASSLSVTVRFGSCPLGRKNGPPATVDTVTATPRTSFGYTCLPTPAPSGSATTPSVNLADVTKALPLPTLAKGQNPPLTAKALEVIHHPGGECRVNLTLEGKKGQDRGDWNEAECEKRVAEPVSYATTVSKTIEVGCDGCAYIRGGVVTPSCARETASSKSVRKEALTTVWVYDCQKRV